MRIPWSVIPPPSAGGGAPVTWDSAINSSYVTYSNGNLTAYMESTNPPTPISIKATVGASIGKKYWEIHYDTDWVGNALIVVGVGNSSALISACVGFEADSWGYFGYNGYYYTNSGYSGPGASYSAGHVIGNAWDADNGKLYFSVDGTWQNSGNPATQTAPAFSGLSGTLYPMVGAYQVSRPNTVTARFASADWSYSAPSGFSQLS
jgi:SPRY domain